MKSLTAVALLTASVKVLAASDFSATCRDEAVDPKTQILTANCDTGDGKGTLKATSLDLDDCFAYTDNEILSRRGNFSQFCDDCHLYYLPDPYWPRLLAWVNCTCIGAADKVAVNIGE
ncbi:hypothetical protein LZ31DRAFT_483666 [Colletotrichum somersetense]|nr:hypothetical protein LZ31DRAFT_483666 [Colletotrichum somersetense]